jgi:hypothetical protein
MVPFVAGVAGDDQERPVRVGDGFTLSRVEIAERFHA